MAKLNLTGPEKLGIAGILIAVAAVMWVWLIQPANYDWVDAGETTAVVDTILPNKKVVGPTYIKALVTLEGGQKILVDLPANPNIQLGSEVTLAIKTDSVDKEKRANSFVSVD